MDRHRRFTCARRSAVSEELRFLCGFVAKQSCVCRGRQLVEQLLMTKDKLFYSIAKGVTPAARILKTQLPVNVYARQLGDCLGEQLAELLRHEDALLA